MHIHGNALPPGFMRDIANGLFLRERGSWPLKEDNDHYGNALETELGEVYSSPEAILMETKRLPAGFVPDGYYGSGTEASIFPAVSDITDFDFIVCFAISSDGAPFCFDCRESVESPQIIWWDDDHWRVVAPDYESFVDLFQLPPRAWHHSSCR